MTFLNALIIFSTKNEDDQILFNNLLESGEYCKYISDR